jgi:hypothetical protein
MSLTSAVEMRTGVSPSPRCYVCAPYEDGPTVRDRVHARIVAAGFEPTSRWAINWNGREDFSRFSPAELQRIAEENDSDLLDAHVALVLARAGAGGEMFAESRLAIDNGLSVVWVGRKTLSAWRRGVVRFDTLDDGIKALCRMREAFEDGARGELLAHLGGAA